MNNKPDVLIGIPVKNMDEFLLVWFTFLRPIHGLTKRHMQVVVCLLKNRFELAKKINDEDLLDSILFNEDTKRKVRLECDLKPQHFHMIMSKLRENKVIVNDKLNKRYIPKIKEDQKTFQLSVIFNINE